MEICAPIVDVLSRLKETCLSSLPSFVETGSSGTYCGTCCTCCAEISFWEAFESSSEALLSVSRLLLTFIGDKSVSGLFAGLVSRP